eukprot:m.243198 g.243198  ORF g.243198 m.243198 type:complete len:76 (-) comp19443_c1_seq20:515-742(-)
MITAYVQMSDTDSDDCNTSNRYFRSADACSGVAKLLAALKCVLDTQNPITCFLSVFSWVDFFPAPPAFRHSGTKL